MTELPDNAMVELARNNMLLVVIREILAKLPEHVQAHVKAALSNAVEQEGVRDFNMRKATEIAAKGLRHDLFGEQPSGT